MNNMKHIIYQNMISMVKIEDVGKIKPNHEYHSCLVYNDDFSKKEIENVTFNESYFENCNLSDSTFKNCCFFNANIMFCNFNNTKFENCIFAQFHFLSCDVSKIKTKNCIFHRCGMKEKDTIKTIPNTNISSCGDDLYEKMKKYLFHYTTWIKNVKCL